VIPVAYAVLNLDAVVQNLAVVRKHAPEAKIMAVIKANGYGHGMLRGAEALKAVDAFAVARADEGVRLRKAGLTNRIVVLEGFTCHSELDEHLQHDLSAVVHSLEQIEIFAARPERSAISVWVKVDTGMNRLGFRPQDLAEMHERLLACSIARQPYHYMTHFANADDVGDRKTLDQIRLFEATVLPYSGQRSMANSAAILGWPQSLADWVRPGIMLFGISPFPDTTGAMLGLRPIMSLHSRLISVKTIAAGETVGYGSGWRCERPTRLGVIAIGYGDGYPRYAKPGTPVLVNGVRVPLIGRVSMDMITVDLAAQPGAKPGDPVTLWGEDLPVEEIARHAETIPYTLVCGITPRVQIVEQS